MNKLTLFLMSASIAMSATSAFADNQIMRVATLDGKELTFSLVDGMNAGIWYNRTTDDSPLNLYVATGSPSFDVDGRPVNSDSEERPGTVYLDMPLASLKDFSVVSNMTGVSDKQISTGINVDIENGCVDVKGVINPVRVLIANSAGLAVIDRIISADSKFELKQFGTGVYVINVDGSSFKFFVK